jgi:NAD(P)-dependent dehydrogenase (short-subunit alcohol dehydrogenase family)
MSYPPSPFSLAGKRLLITGASSGIGRAVAMMAAELGANLVVVARREDRLEALVREAGGGEHRAIPADLTDPEARARIVEEVGTLDGVVYSAGILKVAPMAFLTERVLREVQAVNYESPLLLTQLLLKKRRLAEGASLVFVSSVAARRGALGHAVYAGTKGALEAAVQCLALEGAPRWRANCVAPGMVETDMAAEAAARLGVEALEKHRSDYPLGFGRPEDVAAATCFLLSGAARWITGTVMTVDGGFSAR